MSLTKFCQIHFFVITKLQLIIGNFNNPIHLNSAYKIVSYNEKQLVKLKNMVFDIVIDLDDICKYAQLIGVLGIIKYNTLYFARNNNGKVTKVTSFI